MVRSAYRRKERLRGNVPRFGVAGLAVLLCLTCSAAAAIRTIIASPAPSAQSTNQGYEAEDHFPGAAYFYAADAEARDIAAPAAGSTGTAALPNLPVPASATGLPTDGTIHPAPPFSMRLASATDRARALDCLATAIYYEAAREPDAGQRAVAQVILNRVRHPAFPATVCGVVYQGSEHAGCQFSYACDGAMARTPDPALFRRTLVVAADALGGQVFAPVGMATHYHSYAVTPAWNRQLVMTAAIGAHFFHRWQGYWGTPAAFTQPYRGGEPVPGPHATPIAPVVLASAGMPPSVQHIASLTPGPTPLAVQPAYAESGTVQPLYAAERAASDNSQILDKWRDSGKPLK